MSPKERKRRIEIARDRSTNNRTKKLIIDSFGKREYFRFVDGQLEEYDCTKYRGNQVRLTNEETYAITEFPWTPLEFR